MYSRLYHWIRERDAVSNFRLIIVLVCPVLLFVFAKYILVVVYVLLPFCLFSLCFWRARFWRPVTKFLSGVRAFIYVTLWGGYVKDSAIREHVTRVGQKVTLAAGKPAYSITYCVLKQNHIRAFAYGPNFVVVSHGLYADCRNEDELVSVIAHEVGHLVIGEKENWGSKKLESKRFEEDRADQLAIEYAKKAGYDPNCFVRWLWRMMNYQFRYDGTHPLHDDSQLTHPSALKRIRSVTQTIGSLA